MPVSIASRDRGGNAHARGRCGAGQSRALQTRSIAWGTVTGAKPTHACWHVGSIAYRDGGASTSFRANSAPTFGCQLTVPTRFL